MKKILTIGAYERDNFGDLLFFFIVKEFFKGHDVVPASMIYSDMTDLMGEVIYPYHILLTQFEWDMIIVVGGEIGGIDIHTALNMSLTDGEYEILEKANQELQSTCYDFFTGSSLNRSAYLPNLTFYIKNKNTPLIVNSVGVSALKSMQNTTLQKEFLDILEKTSYLSVRDNSSFEYLTSLNIPNLLSPDIVHTIKKLLDNQVENQLLEQNISDNYILLHCNQYFILENSVDSTIASIKELIKKYNKKIYLFPAGIARHHDSIELYEQIASRVNQELDTTLISVIYERNPFSLAKYIKHSCMWIGTSLHGRIIATSYSIPRVSLSNSKVAEYSMQWDNELPYNIELDDLITSCELGFTIEKSKLDAIATFLETKAYQNFKNNVGLQNES